MTTESAVDLRGAFPPDERDRADAHAATLAALGVDDSIAAELTLAELRELLPDASTVERIRVLRHLRGGAAATRGGASGGGDGPAAAASLPLPDHPSWRGVRRWFETFDWDPREARNEAMAVCDYITVPASLVLGVAATALLEPPGCGDGADAACAYLAAADLVAWMAATVLMMLTVLAAAVGVSLIRLQRDDDVNAWLAAHWFHVYQPFIYFLLGITVALPAALTLRMLLLRQDYPHVWIALVVMPWAMPATFFLGWMGPFRETMGVLWRDLTAVNNGYCFAIMRHPTRAEWYRSYLENKDQQK